MDLERMPNKKKLELCRWYFKAGMFLLPFVWAINTIWFFKEAFFKPPFPEQEEIKKYVIASGAGCIMWTVTLITWVIVFQTNRVGWAEFGDSLSFIIPYGRL